MSATGNEYPDPSSDESWRRLADARQDPDEDGMVAESVTDSATGSSDNDMAEFVSPRPAPSPETIRRARRRHVRTCLILFVATLLSTFLVGSGYAPLDYFAIRSSQEAKDQVERAILREALRTGIPPQSIEDNLWRRCGEGLEYAIPLMVILLCHEMGHYLVAVRNRVPASLPYFIPLPLPPLGTMGAVILQGRGVANRRQMFDIAVCGPLAGLFATIPVLIYGIRTSEFREIPPMLQGLELGEPLILQWMIAWIHGAAPDNQVFTLNGYAMAGWVGIFVTALNLLPVGQLDGGHILYTLLGRRAHLIAWLVILGGIGAMLATGTMSYILILVLLLLTGVRHPPTANDRMRLGWGRQCVGWLTLSFLIIGFTPEPIVISQPNRPQPQQPVPRPGGGEIVDNGQRMMLTPRPAKSARGTFPTTVPTVFHDPDVFRLPTLSAAGGLEE